MPKPATSSSGTTRSITLAGAGLDDAAEGAAEGLQQPARPLSPPGSRRTSSPTRTTWPSCSTTSPSSTGWRRARSPPPRRPPPTAASTASTSSPSSCPPGIRTSPSLTNRAVRERIMAASRVARHPRRRARQPRSCVLEITRLRAERAKLLGFDSHAAFVTADETAKTPEAVADMLGRLAPAAARNARAEQADLQPTWPATPRARAPGTGRSTPRRSRRASTTSTPPPCARTSSRSACCTTASSSRRRALYGITFTERTDLVAYHPDARVFEVRNEDGSPVGLFVLDLYTRDSSAAAPG